MEATLAETISTVIESSMLKYKTEVIQPLLKAKDAEINNLKTELKKTKTKKRSRVSKQKSINYPTV